MRPRLGVLVPCLLGASLALGAPAAWAAPDRGLERLPQGASTEERREQQQRVGVKRQAADAPAYQLPFLCGQSWTGSTRSSHSPSISSVDFNRPQDLGALVTASAGGVVSRVVPRGTTGYGRYVVVDHGLGHSTLYAHLRSTWVVAGQPVAAGSPIGLLGDTGNVTGPHLHFEQRSGSTVVHPWFAGQSFTFGSTLASQNCPSSPLTGDWDGDGRTDVATHQRGAGPGEFRLAPSGGDPVVVGFGKSVDTPLAGDWNRDGVTDLGVWRPKVRMFLLRSATGQVSRIRFGSPRDVPVTGDWNADGRAEVGHWRAGTARFRLRARNGALTVVRLGTRGDRPVVGDWDGDGRTDLGVYSPSAATFTLRVVGADGAVTTWTVPYGVPGDLPVSGDWDGNGVTDLGVWTPATGAFSLRESSARVTRR